MEEFDSQELKILHLDQDASQSKELCIDSTPATCLSQDNTPFKMNFDKEKYPILEKNISYSSKIEEHIEELKKDRDRLIASGAKQSKDRYRGDNKKKQVSRALNHIIQEHYLKLLESFGLKKGRKCNYKDIFAALNENLIKEYPYFAANKPKKLKAIASITYFIFKRSAKTAIEEFKLNSKDTTLMKEELAKYGQFLKNKLSTYKWKDLLEHPVIMIAKNKFYSSEEAQDVFWLKVLGSRPGKNVQTEESIVKEKRMTLVYDYQEFRHHMLETLESKFSSF